MMINKRLIGTVSESKPYIAGNVAFQWLSLAANIAMMASITGLLADLCAGTADGRCIARTLLTAAAAVAVRYVCTRLAAKMSYLSAKSVKKTLHSWFLGTKLYRNNLESYVKGAGMTAGAKRKILCTVTALMVFGFVTMLRKALYIPYAILACVWAAHLFYFGFRVKTITKADAGSSAAPR